MRELPRELISYITFLWRRTCINLLSHQQSYCWIMKNAAGLSAVRQSVMKLTPSLLVLQGDSRMDARG